MSTQIDPMTMATLSPPQVDRTSEPRRATAPRPNSTTGTRDPAAAKSTSHGGFLFSSTIDLLFIANLFWPLLLLVDVFGGVTTHESLIFWQIYFITAPHRWITLVLVTFDHEKTSNRRLSFASLGIGILLVCLCLRFGTGSLLCLGVVDYIWNAWHFASQHHGIFRIYERKGPSSSGQRIAILEKIGFRAFMLYVIARVAGWGWPEGPFASTEAIAALDWYWLAMPLFFVGRQLIRLVKGPATSLAGFAYLTSVMAMFSSMLLAAHFQKGQLVIQLALASAIFHSLEYLSIVTWSMQRSKPPSDKHVFAYLSRMWLFFLAVFVVVIGAGNYLLSRGFFELWVMINLIVAFWHYCFDGMLWKSPQRSKAANVAPQGAA